MNTAYQFYVNVESFYQSLLYALGWSDSLIWFGIGATFFFIGFNMFEPLLQSFVSKFAKVHQKGAALGVANTFAYVGIFLGGAIGGWLYQSFGTSGVAVFVLIVCIFWAAWIFTMRSPGVRDNLFLPYAEYDKEKMDGLKMVNGVTDFYLNETEQIIVVKFDNEIVTAEVIKTFLKK
jgi:MFS family permease